MYLKTIPYYLQILEERHSVGDPPIPNKGREQVQGQNNGNSPSQTRFHRSNLPKQQNVAVQMKQTFDTRNVFSRKREGEDECDLFGRLVAKKLKRIPEDEREDLMYEIGGFFHERFGRLSRSSSAEYVVSFLSSSSVHKEVRPSSSSSTYS